MADTADTCYLFKPINIGISIQHHRIIIGFISKECTQWRQHSCTGPHTHPHNPFTVTSHLITRIVDNVIDDKNIDWNKFKDKKTKEDYIITTTFLVTLINGKNIAISCKNQSELYKNNTQLKLEIERRYWSYKGVQWGIITNKELPKNRLKNIKWLMLGEEIDEEMYFKISSIILETIEELDGKLSDYIEWISKRYV